MSEVTQVADKAKAEVRALETLPKRIEAAIERWYAEHFLRTAITNTTPITATDKAALHAAVAHAIKQE